MVERIGARTVSAELQERFAKLSGDRNPMHMDRAAARRTPPGAPVVHGVHTLLWALESLAATGRLHEPVRQVKARFLRWVYLDEEAVLTMGGAPREGVVQLQVSVKGVTVCTAEVSSGELVVGAVLPNGEAPSRVEAALERTMEELEGARGRVVVAANDAVEGMFPALCERLGAAAVAESAACSYVVGMEAPGLHSMFSKLELNFAEPSLQVAALQYEVVRVDERFRKCRVSVQGTALSGTLEAFVRMPPVKQSSLMELKRVVHAGEFAGVRALVVGGSRGLGELTAKLLAAGGARVAITYATGKVEAEAVAAEIQAEGGEAQTLAYDALKQANPQLAALSWAPSHLYYFATPVIARAKAGVFSSELFAEFTRYYVDGFYELCMAAMAMREDGDALKAFYPSTVFVESRAPGMTEHAMVKAAGEALCADMNVGLAGFHAIAPRLPKLPTDQTAGVLPERELNAVEVLLPLLRAMR